MKFGYVYLDNEFIQKIMIGCPIANNQFSGDAKLRISIQNLVNLDCEVQLGRISLENLESLEFANVILHSIIEGGYDGKEVKLLKGLSNAKTIEFWGFHVNTMLEKESLDLPAFEKLESLELGGFSVNKNLEPLASFLKRTSNLNDLTLRHVTMETQCVFQWRRFIEIECERLKSVEIVCWKGDHAANSLVKYLLMHLQNIETVTISRMNRIPETHDDSS